MTKFGGIGIIMKKIDYDVRASFDEFSSEDTLFIRKLIHDYNIQSVLDIPCANGRNLPVISQIVSKAYFADINPYMVNAVRQKILREKRRNCSAFVLDMSDLSNMPFEVDAILIMQQSFQMLASEPAKKALLNLKRSRSRIIVIDTYDFLCGSLDLPVFLTTPCVFCDADNRQWIRSSTVCAINKFRVNIRHEYKSNCKMYCAEVSLLNYSRDMFLSLCEECGHTIYNFYTDYTFGKDLSLGRTIIVIENDPEARYGKIT